MAPRPGEQRGEDRRDTSVRAVNKYGGEFRKGDAYPRDLRKRVVDAYLELAASEGQRRPRKGYTKIAKQLQVSEKSVERFVRIWEEEQRVDPLERGTLNLEKVTPVHVRYIRTLLEEEKTIYLWEIREMMAVDLEDLVEFPLLSEPTIWRVISRDLGLSKKQVQRIAEQQVTEENMEWRREYIATVSQIEKSRLLFADETATNTNLGYRQRGWAPKHGGDTRATVYEPKLHAANHTTIAMVSLTGIEHRWTKRGAATADDWWHYMCGAENLFASARFDAIVVDNCRVHHAVDQQMAVLLARHNMKLIYLPPYSPDLNPIEEVFSKVKLVLQDERNDLRVEGGLEEGIERAFASITPEDMRGYFKKVYV